MLVSDNVSRYVDVIVDLLGDTDLSTGERVCILELSKLMFVSEHTSEIVSKQKKVVRA